MADVQNLNQLAAEVDGANFDPEVRYAQQEHSLTSIVEEIRFHARWRYWHFTPRYKENFEPRLVEWLNNDGLRREDQVALLRLVPDLAFIDRDDMLSLYGTAFSREICRWLMDRVALDFRADESDQRRQMSQALGETWFCSVTDSFDIGQFCRVKSTLGTVASGAVEDTDGFRSETGHRRLHRCRETQADCASRGRRVLRRTKPYSIEERPARP